MKSLTDYTGAHYSKAFDDAGAFFAFGDEQFAEKKVEGVKYVQIGYGLLCPEENALELNKKMSKIIEEGIAMDIEENGLKGIIKRELWNHEAFYTGEIDDTVEALKRYNITAEMVMETYLFLSKHDTEVCKL